LVSIRRGSSEEEEKRGRVRARIFIDHSIHADVNNKERGWPISLFYSANPLAIELAGYCVGMSKTNSLKEKGRRRKRDPIKKEWGITIDFLSFRPLCDQYKSLPDVIP